MPNGGIGAVAPGREPPSLGVTDAEPSRGGALGDAVYTQALDPKTQNLYLEFKYDETQGRINVSRQSSLKGFARLKEALPGGNARRAKRAADSFVRALRGLRRDSYLPQNQITTVLSSGLKSVTYDNIRVFHSYLNPVAVDGRGGAAARSEDAASHSETEPLLPASLSSTRSEESHRAEQILEKGLDPRSKHLYLDFAYDSVQKNITVAEQQLPKGIASRVKSKLPGSKGRRAEMAAKSFRAALRQAATDIPGLDIDGTVRSARRRVTLPHFRFASGDVGEKGRSLLEARLLERVSRMMPPSLENRHWARITKDLGLDGSDPKLTSYFASRFPEYFVGQVGDPSDFLEEGEFAHHNLPPRLANALVTAAKKMLAGSQPSQTQQGVARIEEHLQRYAQAEQTVENFAVMVRDEQIGKAHEHLNSLATVAEEMGKSDDPLYEGIESGDKASRDQISISVLAESLMGKLPRPSSRKAFAQDLSDNFSELLGKIKEQKDTVIEEAKRPQGGIMGTINSWASWAYNGAWAMIGYPAESETAGGKQPTSATLQQINFQGAFLRGLINNPKIELPNKDSLLAQLKSELGDV